MAAALNGEQLPIKSYTTADGLPSNTINKILADSHGFLWFCTPEGLARFDGYSFKNYNQDQGLPSNYVADLIETRGGEYWVATFRGIARFLPSASDGRKFTVYSLGGSEPPNPISLYEDRVGTIWAGTWRGLYRLTKGSAAFEVVNLGLDLEHPEGAGVRAIRQDPNGDLWVGTTSGIFRREPGGNVHRLMSSLKTWVNSMIEDGRGGLWVGTRDKGLYRLMPGTLPEAPPVIRQFTPKDGMGLVRVRKVIKSRDGTFWMATNAGLTHLRSAEGAERFRTYTTAHGLTEMDLDTIAEDHRGDLWVGSGSSGAMRILRNGYTSYYKEDGFGAPIPYWIFGNETGEPVFLARNAVQDYQAVSVFQGEKFHSYQPNFLPIRYLGWYSNQAAIRGTRDWWFAIGRGLCRFPGVPIEQLAHRRPRRVYTTRDGFASSQFTSVFEDSRGDVWAGTHLAGKYWLSRWEAATDTWHHFAQSEIPASIVQNPAFAEDLSGNVWVSGTRGVFLRCRHGQFERIVGKGLAVSVVYSIYRDLLGRLWMADGEFGLIRIDQPGADQPKFFRYSVAQGLSGNAIGCVTGDKWGRIYAGTGRGLDRISPDTGRVKHYSRSDGLPQGDLSFAYCDRNGTLWFGTWFGFSRFVPEADLPDSTADVKVSAIRIRGVSHPLSDLGETAIAGLTLPSDRNQVQIDFTGLGFRSDELRYQFMLEGADHTWGPPSEQRTVNYASLSPGNYRFLVRAATTDGMVSSLPASFEFQILPPMWQRWWFMLLAACAIGLTVHSLYRFRLRRLLELERIRTRIATDLHDDIGASLSQIALLSELVDQRSDPDVQVRAPLRQIGGISRELVDAMSDIVWSVDPRKDSLANLAQRMRNFAADLLATRDIELRFRTSQTVHDLNMEVRERRQVLLIFKEAVNNIARHSECTEADIDLTVSHDWLTLSLRDNGRGFDPRPAGMGHGLVSMRSRAESLGGTFQISSGAGTAIVVRIPTGRPPGPWQKSLRKYMGRGDVK